MQHYSRTFETGLFKKNIYIFTWTEFYMFRLCLNPAEKISNLFIYAENPNKHFPLLNKLTCSSRFKIFSYNLRAMRPKDMTVRKYIFRSLSDTAIETLSHTFYIRTNIK